VTSWAHKIGSKRHGRSKQTHWAHRNLTKLENRLSGEINIESILTLDEQIKEYEATLKNLKRARNSLLNISKLPPEVLGNIFRWNVTLEGDFGGLVKRSHNFLLVCHHWFKVASSTPELWSFWGNTPGDWVRWCRHSGIAPLDLVLDVDYDEEESLNRIALFHNIVFDILRDRVTRDTIRRIHLKSTDSELLNAVIFPLTTNSEELQPSSVESFILRNEGDGLVDISDLFTRHCYPRLQHLKLENCTASSWDLIAPRVTTLTSANVPIAFSLSRTFLALIFLS